MNRSEGLTVEAGQEYYLCFERNIKGIDPVGVVLGAAVIAAGGSAAGVPVLSEYRHLSLVPKETALAELARTRLIGHGGNEAKGEGQ